MNLAFSVTTTQKTILAVSKKSRWDSDSYN